ncbi:MAG: response regulator transcription factor [Melioribacteraceae bacterium]|nr:response regulator transcription factor [Melioribacteraceae bacterium]
MVKNMPKEKILLVEDEESLAKGLEYNLQEEDYDVTIAVNGRDAVDLFEKDSYDLVILDIMLPYLDGFEVAKIFREKSPQLPILILTAKSKTEDKLKGLMLGADDYLTKPFHLEELLLRIKGMLKRKTWYKELLNISLPVKLGSFEINFETMVCNNGKREFRLTQNEIMVLKYLIDNKGKVVTRKELLENVWHVNPEIETRTVDIFISRLRKYFETDSTDSIVIKSIRGSGYMIE